MYQDFYTIQNSFVGSLALNYNSSGCNLIMTKVFTPINPKDIKAGMKIYDYENSMYFTIGGLDEILSLKELLQYYITNGSFAEYNEATISSTNQGNYPGISITHYRSNIPSILRIVASTKQGGFLHIFYSYGDKQTNVNFNIGLDKTDAMIFVSYLEHYPTFLSTYIALIKFENTKMNELKNQSNPVYQQPNQGYRQPNQQPYTQPNYNQVYQQYYNQQSEGYRQPNYQQYNQPNQGYQQPNQQQYNQQPPQQPTQQYNQSQQAQQYKQQYNQQPPSPPNGSVIYPDSTQQSGPVNQEPKNNNTVLPKDVKSIFDD